ncbi:hypothetical protein DE146DRAFT_749836 [Phaeosphaeria sp. MPI-PUGE-AT-0046c]|nr:hypothetical protein DE146DRAFT_749836 [Phaeosphaeria sp. MPI-PUGE-AT-0046c]
MMDEGEWQEHHQLPGRIHKRGVIVYVYPYGDNEDELKALENGDLGPYYQ